VIKTTMELVSEEQKCDVLIKPLSFYMELCLLLFHDSCWKDMHSRPLLSDKGCRPMTVHTESGY
jgi:hypothetical protein